MSDWEVAILKCMDSFGGKAYLKQIYIKIDDFIELKEEHFKKQYGRPAFQHQVRSHIANLCQADEVINLSRGYYSLTEKGKTRIAHMEL